MNTLCNNCNKNGHLFHNCRLPITSYGIILFRRSNNGNQFLMIRRKDTFGYIDFVRGKYSPYNVEHVQNIVNEMSTQEKSRILTSTFDQLWKLMWGEILNTQYRNEEILSGKKFDIIKNGFVFNTTNINLDYFIQNSSTNWTETEWEFPKGRRNYQEKDLDCALREFEEETGILKEYIHIIENILPFEETFIGTNFKSYKHKYFLAYINNDGDDNLLNYQEAEVSKMEWKTIDECIESIRPYNLEKKQLILNINKLLEEYRLYY
jgi:8-oxo-dGTP pyrophosphatase MutT (NUDIX family)